MCQTTKLSTLKPGDRFCFAKPHRGIEKPYVVEGQYPFKHITTIISEDRIMQPNVEPIAVDDKHDVCICTRAAYTIRHMITKNRSSRQQGSKPSREFLADANPLLYRSERDEDFADAFWN